METSANEPLPTAWITKRFMPTGGVIRANSIKIANKIPNQMRSMPMAFSAGNRIGIISISSETDSKNNPMINTMTPTTNKKPVGVEKVWTMAAVITWGIS